MCNKFMALVGISIRCIRLPKQFSSYFFSTVEKQTYIFAAPAPDCCMLPRPEAQLDFQRKRAALSCLGTVQEMPCYGDALSYRRCIWKPPCKGQLGAIVFLALLHQFPLVFLEFGVQDRNIDGAERSPVSSGCTSSVHSKRKAWLRLQLASEPKPIKYFQSLTWLLKELIFQEASGRVTRYLAPSISYIRALAF